MKAESKYIVYTYDPDAYHEFIAFSVHDSEADADALSSCQANDELNMAKVIIESIEAHYEDGCREDGLCTISVTSMINDNPHKVSFVCFMMCEEYDSSVSTRRQDEARFSIHDHWVYEAIDIEAIADKAGFEHSESQYKHYDAFENACFNDYQVIIREHRQSEKCCLLVEKVNYCDDDALPRWRERQTFKNKEQAESFLLQFRTDEDPDFSGLVAYLREDWDPCANFTYP